MPLDLAHLRGRPLKGEVTPPGDKSISHRALLLAALARGESLIRGLNPGQDVRATATCLEALGVGVRQGPGLARVRGRLVGDTLSGPALSEPDRVLECGNSGTTMRLLLGLLGGQDLFAVMTGDDSLCRRPMGRVTTPLRGMGVSVDGRRGGDQAPLAVRGRSPLTAICYRSPVSSAQVKSALLLAGLFASGTTSVAEPGPSRDHTERMLAAMGARVSRDGGESSVSGPASLDPVEITVPGDMSAAAFPVAAALLVPGSRIVVRGVGLNPTRTGMIEVLRRAGSAIAIHEERLECGEPVGDVEVTHSDIGPLAVTPTEVPSMIDEIPVLCLVAAAAHGTSHISGLGELRVKESDRLMAVVEGLRELGVSVEQEDDAVAISGPVALKTPGRTMDGGGDHRMAMTWAVASLVSGEPVAVRGRDAVSVSYPAFQRDLETLAGFGR